MESGRNGEGKKVQVELSVQTQLAIWQRQNETQELSQEYFDVLEKQLKPFLNSLIAAVAKETQTSFYRLYFLNITAITEQIQGVSDGIDQIFLQITQENSLEDTQTSFAQFLRGVAKIYQKFSKNIYSIALATLEEQNGTLSDTPLSRYEMSLVLQKMQQVLQSLHQELTPIQESMTDAYSEVQDSIQTLENSLHLSLDEILNIVKIEDIIIDFLVKNFNISSELAGRIPLRAAEMVDFDRYCITQQSYVEYQKRLQDRLIKLGLVTICAGIIATTYFNQENPYSTVAIVFSIAVASTLLVQIGETTVYVEAYFERRSRILKASLILGLQNQIGGRVKNPFSQIPKSLKFQKSKKMLSEL